MEMWNVLHGWMCMYAFVIPLVCFSRLCATLTHSLCTTTWQTQYTKLYTVILLWFIDFFHFWVHSTCLMIIMIAWELRSTHSVGSMMYSVFSNVWWKPSMHFIRSNCGYWELKLIYAHNEERFQSFWAVRTHRAIKSTKGLFEISSLNSINHYSKNQILFVSAVPLERFQYFSVWKFVTLPVKSVDSHQLL